MKPAALSRALRHSDDGSLSNRRAVVGLSLVALGSMAVISLYQMGLIRHLPELPIPGLDADKVDASPDAYQYLQTPDATLGLVSYSVTAVLAAMGEPKRATKTPWIPLLMAGKLAIDVVSASKLTADQWTKHRAFCSWCLLAAGASFASIPFVVPEAKTAWRSLRKG